ncbi:MAG: ABC transporter substrate-binding protein [Faecousia sp.]
MKKIISALLVLTMVLALAACGGSNAAPAETKAPEAAAPAAPAAPAASEKVTVTMIAAQYGPKTGDWWTEFEKKFEAANDGIDLVVDCVSWNDIYTVVNTRIANGQAPDLLNIDVFADYQADGLLLPAEEWCSAETYAKFYEAFLDQSVVDGVVWAVPDLASARAMYYNKDILEQAGVAVPTTWDELTAACKTLKEKCPDVYPWGIDMTTDEGQAAFAYYTWGNGGGFVDDNGEWTLNSAENVAAVEYAVGLVKDGLTNSDPATDTRYDLQDLFCAGKLAMMIAPNALSAQAGEAGVNYGFAAIPNNSGTSVSAGVMDRIMCFDNGQSDEQMAAITAVVDAFYDDEPYSDWVLMEGFLPATSAGGEACAAADPAMGAWIDIVGSAKFYPTAKAEWADVKQGVIDVEQQALLGGSVQELLDNLQAEIAG